MDKRYYYELTCLASPDLSETELKDCQDQIASLCSQEELLLRLEPAKKIKLAYPIKKQGEAFLISFGFQAEPQTTVEVKKKVDDMARILRFLVVKKRVVIEEPKPEPTSAGINGQPEPEPPQTPASTPEPAPAIEPKKAKPGKKAASMEDIEKDLEKILGE
jgi:ribosomal protein S6